MTQSDRGSSSPPSGTLALSDQTPWVNTGGMSKMAGFEKRPGGRLIGQVIRGTQPVGFAYERSVDFAKDWHTHDRPMFVLPRLGTRMTIEVARTGQMLTVDEHHVAYVPQGLRHNDIARTRLYDTLALYLEADHLSRLSASLEGRYGVSQAPRTACGSSAPDACPRDRGTVGGEFRGLRIRCDRLAYPTLRWVA